MKKVLIIAYHFPPDNEIGGVRTQGLYKYLREYGWKPVILTKKSKMGLRNYKNVVETPYTEYDLAKSIKSLLGMDTSRPIKSTTNSLTSNNISLFQRICRFLMVEFILYPDEHKNWYKHAYSAGCKIIENEEIDSIISSSSPIISHIIAKSLSEKYNIKWICDFRDLWTLNHYNDYTWIRKKRERKLEKVTLDNASSLTTVSEPLAEKLKTFHHNKNVYSIPNGYDPDDVKKSNYSFPTKLTLTYTGSLYSGKRDPTKIFQAFSELISEEKVNPKKVEIRFYGKREDWFDTEVDKYSLKNIVHHYGFISRNDALKIQRKSHLLLVLLWDNPHEIGVYTGKIFDYLASMRPMIVVGGSKGSVVKELIENTSTGYYVSSINEIKDVLIKFYDEFEKKGSVTYSGVGIEAYSQKEMARKFAEILNDVSANRE